jgi:hypothetical protein
MGHVCSARPPGRARRARRAGRAGRPALALHALVIPCLHVPATSALTPLLHLVRVLSVYSFSVHHVDCTSSSTPRPRPEKASGRLPLPASSLLLPQISFPSSAPRASPCNSSTLANTATRGTLHLSHVHDHSVCNFGRSSSFTTKMINTHSSHVRILLRLS